METVWLSLLQLAEHQPWLALMVVCASLILAKMLLTFVTRLVRGYEPKDKFYCPSCNCERCRQVHTVVQKSDQIGM